MSADSFSFTLEHREQLFQASNDRLTKATVPFLGYEYSRLSHRGTGVFLKIGDRHFVLTAAHVLDLNAIRKIPLTLGPEHRGGPPIQLQGAKIWRSDFPPNEDVNDPEARLADPYDIGFVALTVDHAQQLSNLRLPITLQEVDGTDKPNTGCFLFLGYPDEYSQSSTAIGRVSVELLRYITELDTTNDPGNDINILFKYRPSSVYSDGNETQLPDAHGMSGCGVWRLSTPKPSERWTLDDVKLVATQHEWNRKQHFIRATPVVHTIKAIYQQFADVRSIIDINFGIQTSNWL